MILAPWRFDAQRLDTTKTTTLFEPLAVPGPVWGGNVDVWSAIVVLVRRFYITVPLAALTLFGAYSLTRDVAPEYHATATMILIGPTAQQPPRDAPPLPVNPFVQLGTATVATTMEIDAQNSQSMQQIQSAGGTTDYKVTNANRSPIIDIQTTSKNPQQALSTADQLVTLVRQNLANRQKPYTADARQQITAQVIASPDLAGPDTKARTRAETIAIGAAIVVTILLVLLIDALIVGARRRRQLALEEDAAARHAASRQQTKHEVRLEPAGGERAIERGRPSEQAREEGTSSRAPIVRS